MRRERRQRNDRSRWPQTAAALALTGLVAGLAIGVAGCGLNVQSPDLFLLTRRGQGQTLTLLVNDDGTVRCDGGRPGRRRPTPPPDPASPQQRLPLHDPAPAGDDQLPGHGGGRRPLPASGPGRAVHAPGGPPGLRTELIVRRIGTLAPWPSTGTCIWTSTRCPPTPAGRTASWPPTPCGVG